MNNRTVEFTPVFLGSGRCFHTMDWFRSCQQIASLAPVFVTDNLGGEGFIPLLGADDNIRKLVLIDHVLAKQPTRLGHAWRNLVKLALVPLQVLKLRRVLHGIHNPFIFAHSTYYAFLASFCNVRYSATPQGSEVLVRPFGSRFYRSLLLRSVHHAAFTTVDSNAMAERLEKLSGVRPHVVQNGIDVSSISTITDGPIASQGRWHTTSIRGFEANYRIVEILQARKQQAPRLSLNFCFPFLEGNYDHQIRSLVSETDILHGRLPRKQMYALLKASVCVISIPKSDSSPRSVYEAIFCGAAVLCTHAQYIDALPACMRRRVILVNIDSPRWLAEGLVTASQIVAEPYVPSDEALNLFDQLSSMKRCLSLAVNVLALTR
jgi:hypothetical protein